MSAINTNAQTRILQSSVRSITNELGRLQEQMTTGLKAKTYADYSPAEARRVISLRNSGNQIDTYTKTIETLDMRALRVDVSLAQIGTRVDAIKTSAVKVIGNLMATDEMRQSAQITVQDAYANATASVAGHYVFSGTQADQSPLLPFDDIQNGVNAAIAAATPADDPAAIMTAVSDFFADETNWYQGGAQQGGIRIAQDRTAAPVVRANDPGLRDVLSNLFALSSVDPAAVGDDVYKSIVGRANVGLATASGDVGKAVARNGLLRADFEVTKDSHSQVKAYTDTQLGNIEQVDVFAATTRLQALQSQLEATYTITAQLHQLTLTNYIR